MVDGVHLGRSAPNPAPSSFRSSTSTTWGGYWQVDEPIATPDRSLEPSPDGPAARRIYPLQDAVGAGHPALGGSAIRQYEESRHLHWPPAVSLCYYLRAEAHLLVVLPERCLERCQLRLHLDDEEGSRRCMPGNEVDRPTLTEPAVRHLGQHLPTSTCEQRAGRGDKYGMSVVEQPIHAAAPPANVEVSAGVERLEHGADKSNRRTVHVSALEQRDFLLAYAAARRQPFLCPSEPKPHGTKEPAHAHVIHRPILAAGSLLPVIRGAG